MPLCAVEVTKSDAGMKIMDLTRLSHCIVQVEQRRTSRTLPQCTACQRYGHTKNYCRLGPRCVRCDGSHHYTKCPVPRTAAPKCVNCGDAHPANFKGCSYFIKMASQSPSSASPRTTPQQPPRTATQPLHRRATSQPRGSPPVTSSLHFPPLHSSRTTPAAAPVSYAAASGPRETLPSTATPQQPPTDSLALLFSTLRSLLAPYLPSIVPYLTSFLQFLLSDGSP